MIEQAEFATFVAALFSIMNPIGNVGIFAALTPDRTSAQVRRTAWSCALAVVITLLITTWAGPVILKFFGVTVASLQAAGGLILIMIGLNMLFNRSSHQHTPGEIADAQAQSSIAVVPMAIPIVAGPGTMVTVILAAQKDHTVANKIEISLVIVAASAVCGALFSFAGAISKAIGRSGMGVVTRVMGMIIAAIAMGMLAEGLSKMLPGLA